VPSAFPLQELPRCFDRRIVIHGHSNSGVVRPDIGLSQAVRLDLGRNAAYGAERKPMLKIGGYGGFGVADLRSGYGNGTAQSP
jgi:hypothetical protein